MSIPIPGQKVGAFNMEERQWLRRFRGSSLAHLADAANQLAFRQGLGCITKTWSYPFDRTSKATGAGNVFFNSNIFQTQDFDYYLDIPQTHPGADQIALILTYCAPNDLENELDGVGVLGSAGQSDIRLKLTTAAGSKVDPPSSSGQTWSVIMSGSEMPSPRVVFSNDNAYESVTSGTMTLEYGDGEHGYSARVLRSILYLDRGTLGGYTAPRRIGYDSRAGTSQHLVITIRASYAIMLEATAIEIPKLFT